MVTPDNFKIEIIKNPTYSLKKYKTSSGYEEIESIDNYIDEPFCVFVNGVKLENVKRFAIDLDKSKLTSIKPMDYGTHTEFNNWTYLIEHSFEIEWKLLSLKLNTAI